MNTLSSIYGPLATYITGQILPAVLSVLGAIVALVFAVYGVLHVYASLKGESSSSVFYKLGRVFGEEIYQEGYEKHKAKRRKREQEGRYRDRYDRETFYERYDRGEAREGRDFY